MSSNLTKGKYWPKKNGNKFVPKKGPNLFKRQIIVHEKMREAKDAKWIVVKRQMTIFLRSPKLKEKYFDPYRITAFKINDRYTLEKVQIHEGPFVKSSVTKFLKSMGSMVFN